jgi:HD-GYP domain-containing protein (c-di-GMP phosphodiesterase class II)
VSRLVVQVALALGCAPEEARMPGVAGRLHDSGKIAVPDAILRKPGPLSAEEWALMRTHPVVGAEVVGYVPSLCSLVPSIRSHHERRDGGGYPDGLAGRRFRWGRASARWSMPMMR